MYNILKYYLGISCEVALQRLYRKKRYTNNLEYICNNSQKYIVWVKIKKAYLFSFRIMYKLTPYDWFCGPGSHIVL